MSEPTGVQFDHPAAAHPKIIDAEQGIVEVTPRRKKVAIVGFATSSREMTPFTDPAWEIWGLNQLYRHVPRADRWFEIHVNWNEHVVEGTDHAGWIKDAPIPVYMSERVPDFRSSVRFPIEACIKATGIDYFTSTVAFALGLAILEGFETIGIFGVDLIVGTEYFHQKACVEYLCGVAHGKGLEVFIPSASALLKQSHRYGYQVEPPSHPIKMSMLEARRLELAKERADALNKLHLVDGALQDTEYWYQLAELRMRGGVIGDT